MESQMKSMTYDEYSILSGLTASTLADFAKYDRNDPPPKKSADYFAFGNRFEECVRMRYDNEYQETFQVMPEDAPPIPDDFPEIIDLLKGGSPISAFYKLTKKGEPDGRYKSRHFWLDAIKTGEIDIERPAIDFDDQEKIDIMVDKLVAMPIFGQTLHDYLINAKWSIPFQWETRGVDKKCLFDILITVVVNGKPHSVALDLKSSASESVFWNMWKSRYMYQCRHYTEGLAAMAQYDPWPCLVFIVGQKESPFLPYVAHLDADDEDKADAKYQDNLLKFMDWAEADFAPAGHLPVKTLKVYYNG